MAEAKGNTAVPAPAHGDHDRVQMLSLRADGTPDQSAGVELIGDREVALEQTREQFRQQAVSAVDQAKRAELGIGDADVDQDTQDPAIAELEAAHVAAEKAADKAAESTVADLFKGDDKDPKPGPAKSDSK